MKPSFTLGSIGTLSGINGSNGEISGIGTRRYWGSDGSNGGLGSIDDGIRGLEDSGVVKGSLAVNIYVYMLLVHKASINT